jgi:hypothetical protein
MAQLAAPCHLKPYFEPDFEALNFLWELKDFREIAKAATKVWTHKSMQELSSILPSRKTPAGGQIAGGWLAYQFGLKPFLHDMEDILRASAQSASKAYQKFAERGQDDYNSHFSRYIWEDTEGDRHPASPYWYYCEVTKGTSVKFTATVRHRYFAVTKDPAELIFRQWGLSLDAPTLWNAVPFTFLIDYFIKIGKSLEAVRRWKSNDATTTVVDYSESLLEERYVRHRFHQYVGVDTRLLLDGEYIAPATAPNRVLAELVYSNYSRIRKQPLNYCMPLPQFKLPTGEQGLNMLALARVLL